MMWSSRGQNHFPSQLEHDPVVLVGLSFRPRWLSRFFADEIRPFRQGGNEFTVVAPDRAQTTGTVRLKIDQMIDITLTQVGPDATHVTVAPNPFSKIGPAVQSAYGAFVGSLQGTTGPPVAGTFSTLPSTVLVPARLLAHLKAVTRDECVFDDSVSKFRTPSRPNRYFRARVIATDIHSVPELDSMFQQRGFATISQKTQVQELRNHLSQIQLWSRVVIVTVGALGFLTLIMTLLDNTQRKRQSIALLMSLGAGRLGICYVFCTASIPNQPPGLRCHSDIVTCRSRGPVSLRSELPNFCGDAQNCVRCVSVFVRVRSIRLADAVMGNRSGERRQPSGAGLRSES